MTAVDFWVPGVPVPKGSLRHVGGGRLIESAKGLADWRKAIADAARVHNALSSKGLDEPYTGAVAVTLDFYLPRPASHFRGNDRSRELRATAPTHVKKRPDVDKLARAILDALTDSGVWRDDCLVFDLAARKHYADARIPGVRVQITEVTE